MDNQYWECQFTDGSSDDFRKKCTTVKEFGNGDMIQFKVTNGENYLTLAIIPKSVIKKIVNHYDESLLDKLKG